jgi:A/G-specific adenine glycosylase
MARKRDANGTPGANSGDHEDSIDLDRAWVERIRQRLIAWYEEGHRDLPWRASRDPYRVLVSEMMLVQTTVAAVVPFYARFLARFPDVGALAEADEAEVLKCWEGLGYYRRARQLHAAARAIVVEHGGVFPDDPAALRALPGVGRYIAGAILSFAFGRPAAIVEANTQRVLARWLAWSEDLKTSRSQARLWQAAERLVPESDPGTFNQAFMELGAVVCIPRSPLCLVCPVARDCRARIRGIEGRLPFVSPKPPPLTVTEACALVERQGRWLIVQRAPGGLWERFWEFPTVHLAGADPAGRSLGPAVELADGVRRLTGIEARIGPLVETIRYSVTRHRVELHAYQAVGLSGSPTPGPGLVQAAWVVPEVLMNYPFGSAGRRLAARIAAQQCAPGTGTPGA